MLSYIAYIVRLRSAIQCSIRRGVAVYWSRQSIRHNKNRMRVKQNEATINYTVKADTGLFTLVSLSLGLSLSLWIVFTSAAVSTLRIAMSTPSCG